jgi:hypothetical protein
VHIQTLVSACGVLIALCVWLTQAYLQKQHLRQNLYDKRFRVFYAIQKVLREPDAPKKAKELLGQLEREAAEASFLFGPEIHVLLSDVDDVLRELRCADSAIESGGPSKDDISAILKWLALSARTETLFRPYLQLHHEQNWLARSIARANHWMDSADSLMKSRYE